MANKEDDKTQDEETDAAGIDEAEYDEAEYEEEFDDDFSPADEEEALWWLPYIVLGAILLVGVFGFFGVFNQLLGPYFTSAGSHDAKLATSVVAPAPVKPVRPNIPARPAKPAPPQLFGAAHILLSHQGATRARPTVTRSEAEAKKRAAEIAAQAKKDPSKFADLAKEHSDGPSGPRGGQLGVFPKGKMHPLFQAAVERAKVGGVVGPVKTPFGYHVIKRTK
jgi:hypothetical protein